MTVRSSHRIPLTTDLALADLQLFKRYLNSRYPMSAEWYPMDSLRTIVAARAAAWLVHLRMTPGADIRGRYASGLARVAAQAGQDSLAHAIYKMLLTENRETRSKAVRSGASCDVRQSVILADAIMTFAGLEQPPDRLAKNLVFSEKYTIQLLGLPLIGCSIHSDSTDILYRQYEAILALTTAAGVLQQDSQVVQYGSRLLAFLPRLAHEERIRVVNEQLPYLEMAIAISNLRGRQGLDSLNQEILNLVIPRPDEWASRPASIPHEVLIKSWQFGVRQKIASFGLLGRSAPSIEAHAWLNTPDSTYVESPTARMLADGKVRVIAFGGISAGNLNALDRVHRRFVGRIEVILVTETRGHIGPDIVMPAAECAWLQQYYGMRRKLSLTVAVWAGKKVPGLNGSVLPDPSPIGARYYLGGLRDAVVVVDDKGVIRAYQPLNTRTHEAQLIQRLEMLVSS